LHLIAALWFTSTERFTFNRQQYWPPGEKGSIGSEIRISNQFLITRALHFLESTSDQLVANSNIAYLKGLLDELAHELAHIVYDKLAHIVYITGKDKNVAKMNPLELRRKIMAKIGSVERVYVSGASLKIYCSTNDQKHVLLSSTQLDD